MIFSVKKMIKDHRSTLTTVASVGAGVFLAKNYVRGRLEEVKDRIDQERLAKDILKRRFDQTREDVEYTVMALLPDLAEGILSELNVEEVTKELQNLRAGGAAAVEGSPLRSPLRPPSSLASSTDLDARSDAGLSTSGLQGWVEAGHAAGTYSNGEGSQLSSSFVTNLSGSEPSSSSASVSGDVSDREQETRRPAPTTDLTSSIASITSTSSANSHASSSSSSRSKVQLWNTLKILTFTRTLTAIYAVSLLSLFTSIQLTILAREKYVRGIYQMEREERMREEIESKFRQQMSITGMAFSLLKSKLGFSTDEADLFESLNSHSTLAENDSDGPSITRLSDPTFDSLSTKYLTLSYHLLHIGFRDLTARVQSAVEEVLQPVSLKTRLSLSDVHRIVRDIRRKVEWEITFEGRERKVTFEYSCIPQTRELVERTLRLGGWEDVTMHPLPENEDLLSPLPSEVESSQLSYDFESRAIGLDTTVPDLHAPPIRASPSSFTSENPQFTQWLDETRSLLISSDFTYVLDSCLDQAVSVLMDNLDQGVFAKNDPSEDPRIRMASLLPPLAHWSKQILTGLPSEAVDGLLGSSGSGGLREVHGLMAIIFARFEDNVPT